MTNYRYSEDIWKYVLHDGVPFCHWGGRDISYKVLNNLNLKQGDKLCDLCCGDAGTLTLINKSNVEVYGIDISKTALRRARKRFEGRDNFHFIQSDVRNMPFSDGFFDKTFAQDPDVFLYSNKAGVMKEISRVTRKGGIFVLQTYCATSRLGQREKEKTEAILRNMGYPFVDVLTSDEITSVLKLSGFVIKEAEDLHGVYEQDNSRMIHNLERNWLDMLKANENKANRMKEMLYWERYLFSKKAWTGTLQIAEKK